MIPWAIEGGAHFLGGAHQFETNKPLPQLSPGAQALVKRAYADIDPARLLDYHTHLVSVGTDCKECFIHRDFRSMLHPVKNIRFKVYASASGVTDLSDGDRLFRERLIDLVKTLPVKGRHVVLGFDRAHDKAGNVDLSQTDFYITNEYAYNATRLLPDRLVTGISVHPARKDALIELEKWARRGARIVKWLPNAMVIDPSDPAHRPFYRVMKKYDMILLTHGGEERAVDADEYQEYGNPLRLRLPLDMGVKVIVAHCASLGKADDLDHPGTAPVPNYDLFVRLLGEKKYQGLVFGDISAITQFNRLGKAPDPEPLRHVLAHPELHKFLVNGSDYPLPAINVVIRTGRLADLGFISPEERGWLNEIYRAHPLLFDFVLKRTVHHPDNPAQKLSGSIFHEKPGLTPWALSR